MVVNAEACVESDRDRRGTARADQVEGICHDLKQCIATARLLSDPGMTKDAEPDLRRRLEMLHQQLEDAAALVAMLNREVAESTSRTDLAEVTASCVGPLRTVRAIDFEVGGGEHVLTGDRSLMRRAIANLLDNACRATPQAGEVRVSVGSEGPQSYVEVVDEGPGFGQIAHGAGLGLQVVRHAVWRGGGQLRIETGPRGGTSVRMSFPAVRQDVR